LTQEAQVALIKIGGSGRTCFIRQRRFGRFSLGKRRICASKFAKLKDAGSHFYLVNFLGRAPCTGFKSLFERAILGRLVQ
jgi:hypothetical protein